MGVGDVQISLCTTTHCANLESSRFFERIVNMKRRSLFVLLVVSLVAVAGTGWFNYFGSVAASRGNIREASFLAAEFTGFVRESGRLPTREEAQKFATRLPLIEVRDGVYVYRCRHRGQDALLIQRAGDGRFQFSVKGDAYE